MPSSVKTRTKTVVPKTTLALTSATLPYLVTVATLGVRGAVAADPVLAHGLSTLAGALTNAPVAAAHDLPYTDPARMVGSPARG